MKLSGKELGHIIALEAMAQYMMLFYTTQKPINTNLISCELHI